MIDMCGVIWIAKVSGNGLGKGGTFSRKLIV
jgi:hypothetical protein